MNKKIQHPKTLTFVKYLLTISCVILYVTPLICFLYLHGRLIKDNYDLYLKITVILMVFAIIFAMVFVTIRIYLHFQSKFQWDKRDLMLNVIWLILFSVVMNLSIIMVILSFFISVNAFSITFYVLYPLTVIGGMVASFLEWRARISEQVYIYKIWEKTQKKDEEVKEPKTSVKINTAIDKTSLKEEVKSKDKNPFLEDGDKND